mmetsp:Transcript_114046/g.303167  ORF Transcript_114046/g.303167 Transcript_114046/m.303167 type:complete len:231 (+) Transcript_114046:873-1565(+)
MLLLQLLLRLGPRHLRALRALQGLLHRVLGGRGHLLGLCLRLQGGLFGGLCELYGLAGLRNLHIVLCKLGQSADRSSPLAELALGQLLNGCDVERSLGKAPVCVRGEAVEGRQRGRTDLLEALAGPGLVQAGAKARLAMVFALALLLAVLKVHERPREAVEAPTAEVPDSPHGALVCEALSEDARSHRADPLEGADARLRDLMEGLRLKLLVNALVDVEGLHSGQASSTE